MFDRVDSPSAYIQQISIYVGSELTKILFDIVNQWTKPLQGTFAPIYMDNAYTCIVMLKHLYRHNIYATGTIRANHKFLPQDIKKPPRLTRGQHKSFQDTDNPFFTSTVWMDVKCVYFASSFHRPNVTGVTLR